MRVRRCTTGTRRTPQFSTTVGIHGFADVTPKRRRLKSTTPLARQSKWTSGATRASMRKGCGWAATPTMASRIGAPAAAGNTSQASSGYPRCDFLCLRDRIANIGRAQLRSSSVPPRRCPSRSSPPRESSCGGGSTSSEGALRLGQGAGAASCCSARNMSEFASGRTTACLEGTTKPRSNRTTRPPSNGSVSRKSRSWPPPRRHPFQTAAGCGSTHRMDNPGGGRRWC